MWFAGLRGAIAFALSTGMPGASKDVYASTTLMVVIFTTIGCGGLTEPLLHRMNVKIQASLYMFDGDTGHVRVNFSSSWWLARHRASQQCFCQYLGVVLTTGAFMNITDRFEYFLLLIYSYINGHI